MKIKLLTAVPDAVPALPQPAHADDDAPAGQGKRREGKGCIREGRKRGEETSFTAKLLIILLALRL